jgi:hypothetical protein
MTSREGDFTTVHLVPKDGAIGTMPIFRFNPPGILVNPALKQPGWLGMTLEVRTDSPRNPEIWKNYNVSNFSVEQEFDIDSHARLLAKIAHATAVGHLGLSGFAPWLPPYILGKDECLSYLVGGCDANESPANQLHEVTYEVFPWEASFLVQVKIRLFAQFGGPHALVVVGSSTREMLDNLQSLAIEV